MALEKRNVPLFMFGVQAIVSSDVCRGPCYRFVIDV